MYCSTPFHSLLTSDIKTCTCNVVVPTCTCNYEKILCCDHSNESSFFSSSLIRGVKGGGSHHEFKNNSFAFHESRNK